MHLILTDHTGAEVMVDMTRTTMRRSFDSLGAPVVSIELGKGHTVNVIQTFEEIAEAIGAKRVGSDAHALGLPREDEDHE